MNRKLKARIVETYGSQADFAAALRIDESIVSRIIRGRRVLSPEDTEKWARILDIDPAVIQKSDK